MWPRTILYPSAAPFRQPDKGPAQVKGVGRDPDESRTLFVFLDRCPTDTDIRRIHDILREAHVNAQ